MLTEITYGHMATGRDLKVTLLTYFSHSCWFVFHRLWHYTQKTNFPRIFQKEPKGEHSETVFRGNVLLTYRKPSWLINRGHSRNQQIANWQIVRQINKQNSFRNKAIAKSNYMTNTRLTRRMCFLTDQIALPDFAVGAMENWGLISYQESGLLYDEETASTFDKERVSTLIAHELAHQVNIVISLIWHCISHHWLKYIGWSISVSKRNTTLIERQCTNSYKFATKSKSSKLPWDCVRISCVKRKMLIEIELLYKTSEVRQEPQIYIFCLSYICYTYCSFLHSIL